MSCCALFIVGQSIVRNHPDTARDFGTVASVIDLSNTFGASRKS
jgi:hypothetical protein